MKLSLEPDEHMRWIYDYTTMNAPTLTRAQIEHAKNHGDAVQRRGGIMLALAIVFAVLACAYLKYFSR